MYLERKVKVPMEQILEKVEIGEVISRSKIFIDPVTVKPACENKNSGRWYCVTHQRLFDNQLQKDVHISTGKHRLTWICYDHGPEVP